MTHTGFPWSRSLIVGLCLFSVFLSSCNRTSEPVKLGLAINLSGRGGMSGEHIRNGALLAVRMVNENGGINGRPLVLLVRDDENKAEQIRKIDEALIDEGVTAVIGHSYSNNTIVAYPSVVSRGVLLITGFTSTNELSGRDDLFFRTSVDCNLFGREAAELFNTRQVKSLAVVMDMINSGYALSYVEVMKKYFAGTLTEVRFKSGEDEAWPRIIGEVLAAEPDMVMSLAEAGVTGIVAQKLRNAGYAGDLAASIWAQDPALLNFGNKAVDGMSIITFIPEENRRRDYLLFAERMEKEFNEKVNAGSARSFELIMILADALQRCEEITSQELKKRLLEKQYDTIMGKVRFDQYGDVIRPIYEVVVADGYFRTKGVI